MKIYTKTGDDGTTSLFGGTRVRKHHGRIDAYGTVDELNAHLGAARTMQPAPALEAVLARLQTDLFILGSDLATPMETRNVSVPRITEERIRWVEERIDTFEAQLVPLTYFILPGGCALASALHVCRTVCRRAERLTVGVADTEHINPLDVQYLNRVSDLLFVLARVANADAGIADAAWKND
jgi:cob(I)alamin adenosyltransferase